MTLKKWKDHMGESFFTLEPVARKVTIDNHLYNECKECKARMKTRQKERARKEREDCMKSLGLVKCKVNGKTFWE